MTSSMQASVRRAPTVVGISDFAVSAAREESIITYALGSCIAVVAYDPRIGAAGLLHFLLPTANGTSRSTEQPAMFADTGVPLLFEAMYRLGSKKPDLVVKLAGGASMGVAGTDCFDVGRRNLNAVRKIFWKNGVLVAAEDVGGSCSRTVRVDIRSGKTVVRTSAGEKEL